MRQARVWLGLALVGGGLACGGGPEPAGRPGAVDSTSAWLRVENQTFDDLNVGVVSTDNTRQRLGRSTANTSVVFRIPPNFVSGRTRLRFMVDPIGRVREGFTRELDVIPGDTVVMIIPPA